MPMQITNHAATTPAPTPIPRVGLVPYTQPDGSTAYLDAAFVRGVVEEKSPQKRTVIQGTDEGGKVVSVGYATEPAATLAAQFNAATAAHHEKAMAAAPVDPASPTGQAFLAKVAEQGKRIDAQDAAIAGLATQINELFQHVELLAEAITPAAPPTSPAAAELLIAAAAAAAGKGNGKKDGKPAPAPAPVATLPATPAPVVATPATPAPAPAPPVASAPDPATSPAATDKAAPLPLPG